MGKIRIIVIFIFLFILILTGTLSYYIIEKWSFLDSLYMTVIVITTIGFKEVHPLSINGQIFTIIFSILGFVSFFVTVSIFSSIIIELTILSNSREKIMIKKINKLKNHIIICGVGKVGRHVIDSILNKNKEVVVIDKEKDILTNFTASNKYKNLYYLIGDATREEILILAGVERASFLISCVRDDAVNLFISLTAKKLNPLLKIASYVLDEINISKFYHIGVDEVVSGDFVIGERLAASLLNKNILTFLEQTNVINQNESFYIGDIVIKEKSRFIGKSIKDADIYRNVGLLIFAIRKKNEKSFIFNPDSQLVLEQGDVLITFGSKKDINNLDNYLNCKK